MYIFLMKFDGNQNIIILVTLMYYDIIKIYVFLCVYQEGCPLFIIFSLAGRIIGITISLVLITLIILYIRKVCINIDKQHKNPTFLFFLKIAIAVTIIVILLLLMFLLSSFGVNS